MKRILILLSAIFMCLNLLAQNVSQLAISAVLSDDTTIPQSSANLLLNRLKSAIVQNGFLETDNQRFVLTASVDIIEKGTTSAGMLMQKMAITLYVGDVLENKIYSSHTINTVGIGQSDIKAYNMAFSKVVPSPIKPLLEQANNRVMEYYTSNYPTLETEVNNLVETGQYDEAISKLINVPTICSEEYAKAQKKCVDIYYKKMEYLAQQQKAKTDKEGLVLIQQAKAAWSSRQDYESASNALALLAQIDPSAGCLETANAFIKEINDKLRADERNEAAIAKRNWEFKMRQYEDNLAMQKQRQADNAAIMGTLAERFGRFDINYQKDVTKRWGTAKSK